MKVLPTETDRKLRTPGCINFKAIIIPHLPKSTLSTGLKQNSRLFLTTFHETK